MQTIIVDPYPREMKLIFTPKKLQLLKKKYQLINAPNKNKQNFYEKNIAKADFIIGQPNLPSSLLIKAKKLKAIFNVESNFMDNMDYEYCFSNNIYVLSTAPVFAQTVAEIAVGFTFSLKRDIHQSHLDFIKGQEKYGLEGNKGSSLLKNNQIGFIGYGDLAKNLHPLLKPYTNNFFVYDPWLSEKQLRDWGTTPCSLNKIFKDCDVIYILATITTKNQNMIDQKLLNLMKEKLQVHYPKELRVKENLHNFFYCQLLTYKIKYQNHVCLLSDGKYTLLYHFFVFLFQLKWHYLVEKKSY